MKIKRLVPIASVLVLLLAFAVPGMKAQSASGIQSAYASDAGKLSDKFTGIARVMADKYDWKPGPGVRSMGEVLNLIVVENGMLTRVLTGASGAASKPAPITDPTKLQDALKSSYADLQSAIRGLSDSDLKSSVKLFGRDMTKQDAVMLLIADQHEHLGQSIAYARVNGVVPPWSK